MRHHTGHRVGNEGKVGSGMCASKQRARGGGGGGGGEGDRAGMCARGEGGREIARARARPRRAFLLFSPLIDWQSDWRQ
jgi:hypothetical protein